jgi:hypothetical protein
MTDEHIEEPQLPAVREKERVPIVADERGILPIVPRNIEEASRYANGLVAANQVPTAFRVGGKADGAPNAPLILMGVLKSMEVGLPPQTGLEVLLPLNGRFTLWGEGPMALALQSGKVKNYVEKQIGPAFDPELPLGEWPNQFGFVVQIWRVGMEDPFIGTFTVSHAKRQRLWMNSYKKPWLESPLRMLKIRARAFALRDGFADCLMGLGIKEEIEDAMPDLEPAELEDHGTRHASALDDEPETAPAEEEHRPSGEVFDDARAEAGIEEDGDPPTLV